MNYQCTKEFMMEESSTNEDDQIVYSSHDGGPLPILGDPGHKAMVDFVTRLPSQLAKRDAIPVSYTHLTLPTTPYV